MERSLDVQRAEFSKSSFLATPLSGLIIWLMVGIAGLTRPATATVWVLFIGTGSHFHVRIYCADDDRPMCKDRPPFYSWHQSPDQAPAVATLKPNES